MSARVSMSEVSNSIRRCTTCGCGGIGGVDGRPEGFFFDTEGKMVIAKSDGRGRCEILPSLSISPYVRSAWINGNSSTLRLRDSSWSRGPPKASKPETIVSQGSCGSCSGVAVSGGMASCTRISRNCVSLEQKPLEAFQTHLSCHRSGGLPARLRHPAQSLVL